ncbi:MAG: hypothetical protein AAF629_11225 [Chloroflexota bacterium]
MKVNGAGGTSGGLGSFFIGLVMAIAGLYLFMNQVQVSSGFWGYRFGLLGGASVSAFGVTLIPFLLGVGIIFFNVKSWLGWALAGLSFLTIIIGIIVSLRVHFASTSLYVVIMIFILLAGGLGLLARSLFSYDQET